MWNVLLLILFACLSLPAFANPDCANLTMVGSLRVIGKIESQKYEAKFQAIGMPAKRIVLVTTITTFEAFGRVMPPPDGHGVWVDLSKKEKETIKLNSGHVEDLPLVRESNECTAWGKKMLAEERAKYEKEEAESQKRSEEVDREIAEREKEQKAKAEKEEADLENIRKEQGDNAYYAEKRAREKAERDLRIKARLAWQNKERLAREEESKQIDAKYEAWQNKSLEERVAHCKATQPNLAEVDYETTYCP